MSFSTDTRSTASVRQLPAVARTPLGRTAPWWLPVADWAERNLGGLVSPVNGLPAIVVGSAEHHALNVLAMAHPGHDASVNDALFYELDRAVVVPDGEIENGIIRMGSEVVYRSGAGPQHRVTIVYPGEADPDTGKISVLSPAGAALIGLRKGQSMPLRNDDGSRTTLTVVSVREPSPVLARQVSEPADA